MRSEKNWSQEQLATQLQLKGVDVSRDMLARIELCVTRVNLDFLLGLQRVFRLPIIRFFPNHIQDLDALFAQEDASRLPEPDSPKKPRRKCQKLTKRRKPR
ncbi:MAG: helix-turn-helix domain-containing protein [Limisphaerales bacterium]